MPTGPPTRLKPTAAFPFSVVTIAGVPNWPELFCAFILTKIGPVIRGLGVGVGVAVGRGVLGIGVTIGVGVTSNISGVGLGVSVLERSSKAVRLLGTGSGLTER